MDAFSFEDFDMSGVLPTPSTFYENPYGPQVPSRASDGSTLNMLEDLLSPPDDDHDMMMMGERTPPASRSDDTLSASDDEDESEFGELEHGEHEMGAEAAAMLQEDVFPLDMDDPHVDHSQPLRIPKTRTAPDKRYSPFGISSSPRPRARPLVAPKLSSSLPLAALTLSPDNKKCACCGCGK